MQSSYSRYPYSYPVVDVIETPRTHPFLTFLGVVLLVGVAWWIISSLGVKKGKKAPKSVKKGPTTTLPNGDVTIMNPGLGPLYPTPGGPKG